MSGRVTPIRGKRRPNTKAPGKKPNAHRQRLIAKRKKQYRASGLFARREAKRLEQMSGSPDVTGT
ncbi:MAG: hypothetical protein ACLFR7_06030 [Opitutales bacterium]